MHISEILAYCKSMARIEYRDYGEVTSWRADKLSRNKARLKCLEYIRCHMLKNISIVGKFYGTRLEITENTIDYCAGQYPPTEIYWALFDALYQTVKERSK
jgi:hypothetical protein